MAHESFTKSHFNPFQSHNKQRVQRLAQEFHAEFKANLNAFTLFREKTSLYATHKWLALDNSSGWN